MLAAALVILQIAVSPAVPAPDGLVRVSVSGLRAPAASVVIHGGVASEGKLFGLVPLRDAGHGRWWTILRAPGLEGVYPVRVRADGTYSETMTAVAVLPKDFAHAPSGATPAAALEAWRAASPGGLTLATVSTVRYGFYYHRDQRYNRLFRVEVTALQAWPRWGLEAGTSVRYVDVVRRSQLEPWRIAGFVPAP